MLKIWIDEIRKQSELYKIDAWKYQISGNVIELSILPVFLKKKETYRCAVIAIGQVLKALSCKIEKQESNFHIQTFPSIENPGLVATLRMDKNILSLRRSEKNQFKSLKENTPETAISMLAEYHQLEIEELTTPFEFQTEDVDFDDFTCWFTLYSTFNNPFIWLNIGSLKESIQHDCHNLLGINGCAIIDCCSVLEDEKPSIKTPKSKYLQSIIGVNTATLSTK